MGNRATRTWRGVGKYLSRQGSCQLRWPAISLPGLPRSGWRREKEAKLDATSLAVLVARVGATDQKIVTSTIEEGRLVEMGKPLHSMVLPGNCHYLEQEA